MFGPKPPEAAGEAQGVVGGEDRDADLPGQALVLQQLQTVPQGQAVRSEQLRGGGHKNAVGLVHAQAAQGGAGLGFHQVGTAVGADGGDRDAERIGPRHDVADSALGLGRAARQVEHAQPRAGGDLQDIAHLGRAGEAFDQL